MYVNNNIDFLDALTIFSVFLQIMSVQQNEMQSSNDDILAELQTQDKKYLEKIIEQNNLILEQLAKLG